MPEGRYRADRREQYRIFIHFLQHFPANQITLRPGVQEFVRREMRLGVGDLEEALKRWTQAVLLPLHQCVDKHSAATNKEGPPKFSQLLKDARAIRFHVEAERCKSTSG